MLVVAELDEPFVPLPDDLLVNLRDSRCGRKHRLCAQGRDTHLPEMCLVVGRLRLAVVSACVRVHPPDV